MGSRTWVKIYCDNWINGSLRQEPLEVRAVWVDLLALTGTTLFSDIGELKLADRVGYTDEQIAGVLAIHIDTWLSVKKRLIQTERITVDKYNVVKILNWKRYQSEYLRQKPHRSTEFKEKRESILERDSYTCQKCQKNRNELGVPLCIHHIDNDPENNEDDNLITLCMSCHSTLLKKATHPQREGERLEQAEHLKSIVKFNTKVQQ